MSNDAAGYETSGDALKEPSSTRQYWLDALDAASKEEKAWREQAEKTWKIYTGETRASFNILHSNVETTVPAIYNSVPVPDCRPRYNDKNESARKAAQVLERALAYESDEYDIDEQLEKVVRDMEVPGRGVAWVEFDPLIVAEKDPSGAPLLGADGKPVEKIVWASVRASYLPWQRFRRGPGATWQEVRWVAREKFLTRDELVALAGAEIGNAVDLDATQHGGLEDSKERSKREKTVWKCAAVWEIWDRDRRKVCNVARGYDKGPIAVLDDPLGLKDFFPTPRPMQFLSMPGSMVPIAPYSLYSAQAEELNTISARILKLIEVARYRGIRASEIKELDDFESLEDGQFMASKEAMGLLQNNGSLANAIWVMPLGELIALIRELVANRETIKQTIYEITGIADIMRGATIASETLGAQQLKAQWGSIRVQMRQKEVQRYCRDLYRLKAEIIAEHFPPDVLSMIAGEALAPEVIELLQSDIHRRFMVDIETDSTIQSDRARDQRTMSAFMDASSRFLQVAGPAVQQGMLPPTLPLVIFQSFASKFKLGKQVDDALAKLTEAAEPMMQQKLEQEDEARQKRDEAAAIGKQTAIAELQKKQGEAAGQAIENRNAEAMPGLQERGFVG